MADSNNPVELSDIARRLLQAMALNPNRLEYQTSVLGGSFLDSDIERLDAAYEELENHNFAVYSGTSISFFGAQKPLRKITDVGIKFLDNGEAA